MARKKVSVFVPVDELGRFSRECESVEDLQGLALWLNDSKSSEFRRQAYGIEYGKHPIPLEPGALAGSKASLIEKACGKFFKSWLEDINEKAHIEIVEGFLGEPYSQKAAAELSKARGILRGFLASMKEDMFGSAMANANMSDEAVKDLLKSLQSDIRGFGALTDILSLRHDEAMKVGVSDFRQSNECRIAVKRPREETIERKRPQWGDFAPLIEYMVSRLGPQESAELLGRFDAYVNSGWAAHDMDVSQRGGEKLSELRNAMLELAKNPQGADMERIRRSLDDRFLELFKAVKIEGSKSKSRSARDYTATILDKPAYEDGKAGSGMVDWVLRSVDGSRLLIGFATSDQFIQSQDDQWARHMWGVANSVASGGGGFADAGISPDVSVEISAVAPAALTANAGDSIKEMFAAQMPPLMMERVNTLAFLCSLSRGGTPADFAKVEFKMIGGSCMEWEGARLQANAFEEPERSQKIVLALCRLVADTLNDVKKLGWGHEVMNAEKSNIGSGARNFVVWMNQTASIVQKWAKNDTKEECSAILAQAVDAMEHFSRPFANSDDAAISNSLKLLSLEWRSEFCKKKKAPKKRKVS